MKSGDFISEIEPGILRLVAGIFTTPLQMHVSSVDPGGPLLRVSWCAFHQHLTLLPTSGLGGASPLSGRVILSISSWMVAQVRLPVHLAFPRLVGYPGYDALLGQVMILQ